MMTAFSNYRTGYQHFCSFVKTHKPSLDEYCALAVPEIVKAQGVIGKNQVRMELRWLQLSRPYYKVWPSIAVPLTKLRLDIDSSQFSVPGGTLCIRFLEKASSAVPGIAAVLIDDTVVYDESTNTRGMSMVYQRSEGKREGFLGLALIPGETVQASVDRAEANTYQAIRSEMNTGDLDMRINQQTHEIGLKCLKIALSVCLLARDPSFILPDVLAEDRQRFDETDDPELRQRLIDKARKRGIVGWRVGESYETIPHFRRPHFALRHTGKGRAVPRIVPVKGAIVHRQKLTAVPTGHMEDDGTEVEE